LSTVTETVSGIASIAIASEKLVLLPATGSLGVGTADLAKVGLNTVTLTVSGIATADSYYGDGVNLVGIVTQLVSGIGIDLDPTNGKGRVTVTSYRPVGKTIYVSQNGDDSNTGLAENHPKKTIKNAAGIASTGDTIKVFPGVYVENNPVVLNKTVSVEGTELRNCIVTPQNSGSDLFHVNNGCHITDLSFIGPESTNGASVIAFQPLAGVSSDRFFDGARMIRMNLEFISNETVSYLNSSDYPGFSMNSATTKNCAEDIRSVFSAVCHDITRGGNSKCVGAGKSYYTEAGALQHIVGVKTETIDAMRYAADIARSVINNAIWAGKLSGSPVAITTASYDNSTGIVRIEATSHDLSKDDPVKITGLGFTCPSGPGTVIYPSGAYGYNFPVHNIVDNNTFDVIVGQSTLPHTYVSGGQIQKLENYQQEHTQVRDMSMQPDPITGYNNGLNGCVNVVSAIYSCVGVVTTIIRDGINGSGINTTYPADYDGQSNNNFSSSKIGGSTYSPGVGPITQGPYIRNCTNFIGNSIGMKVDGFHAEPGDKRDIGVTGTMSVDSYTQYNQNGIGVSISNGAYAQLVSLFTICNDIGHWATGGGQCDITNSNSSFGNKGLVSDGVGDEYSRSIYRYTGKVVSEVDTDGDTPDTVTISGIGTNRPYDGQAIYFDTLYYEIQSVEILDGGSGYSQENPPTILVADPTGPNGITAELSANVDSFGKVTSIDVINGGSQYLSTPSTVVTQNGGSGLSFAIKRYPLYYGIESATLPSVGISTVILQQNLNNTVGAGSTVYFTRVSLQLATTISLEWVGSGTNINTAKPALGGVTIPDNEFVMQNGGKIIFTGTNQSGNFRIGPDLTVNQLTGTISGRAFNQSLLNTVTPLIIALG